MPARVVAIGVPLTKEQKDQIKKATGAECTEVLFVGETDKPKLNGELTSPQDKALAQMIWDTNKDLKKDVEKEAKGAHRADGSTSKGTGPSLCFVR
jgi:hypothetical protein